MYFCTSASLTIRGVSYNRDRVPRIREIFMFHLALAWQYVFAMVVIVPNWIIRYTKDLI